MSGGQDEGSGDLGSPKLAQGIVGDSTAIPSCFFFSFGMIGRRAWLNRVT